MIDVPVALATTGEFTPALPPGAILVVRDHFILYPTRLVIAGNPDFDTWEAAGPVFKAMGKHSQWWLGDWIIQGEAQYGERFFQAFEGTEYTLQGLKDVVWVCERVDPVIRRSELSFEHHRKVAPHSPDKQIEYLEWAVENDSSAGRLAAYIKQDQQPKEEEDPAGETTAPPVQTVAQLISVDPTDETGETIAAVFHLTPLAAKELARLLEQSLTASPRVNLIVSTL